MVLLPLKGEIIMALTSLPNSANKANTRKLLEKGLANRKAAADLINNLGTFSVVMIVTDAAASTTLAGVLPGDVVVDLTTVAKNLTAQVVVATADTLAFTPVLHDVLIVLRPVSIA
jgi:hypothetical protein